MWKQFLSLFTTPSNPPVTVKVTKRKLCEETLQSLNTDSFKYSVKSGRRTRITTHYKTIEEYTECVKYLQRLVRQDAVIPTDLFVNNFSCTMDQFLISSDGYYIDTERAIRDFHREALKLCYMLAACDKETVGLHEHYGRILTPWFTNVTQITKAIIEVTHHH